MKWILFYQNPHDRVCFITDESQDKTSLSYRKFCDSIFKYPIKDPGNLQIELDTFHTIMLDVQTGQWERVVPDKEDCNVTFEQLVKLNPSIEEKEKQQVEKKDREVNLTKSYFDKKWEEKRKGLFADYGK